MGKRTFSIVLALALVAGVFSALPASAQDAPTAVPEVANIEDPLGDANYLNDQGQPGVCSGTNCVVVPDNDDNTTPADVHTAADIMKVWFSHGADKVSAHIQVENPPPKAAGLYYIVYASPGEGTNAASTVGCLRWVGLIGGKQQGQNTTWQGPDQAKLFDHCNEGSAYYSTGVEAEVKIETLEDGTGIVTITGPRAQSPLLANGLKLGAPQAQVRHLFGEDTTVGFSANGVIDTTKPGTDYELTTGGPVVAPAPEEPKEEPPGKSDPPGKGKKKGCKKGKGKKKGACPEKPKPPVAPSCPAYVPGEMGAEAETTVVTDDATEEKPIEIDVPLGLATGNVGSDRTTRAKHNVQIDSKLAEAGFYARLESPAGDDPDLYVYYASGKQAAVAGGFNPFLIGGPLPNPTNHATINSLNGQGSGGHSEFTAEQIDGLRSPDCQGWTLDLVNWGGRGGTYKLKLWVGEIQNDPAPEQEAESALDTFFGLLMSR